MEAGNSTTTMLRTKSSSRVRIPNFLADEKEVPDHDNSSTSSEATSNGWAFEVPEIQTPSGRLQAAVVLLSHRVEWVNNLFARHSRQAGERLLYFQAIHDGQRPIYREEKCSPQLDNEERELRVCAVSSIRATYDQFVHELIGEVDRMGKKDAKNVENAFERQARRVETLHNKVMRQMVLPEQKYKKFLKRVCRTDFERRLKMLESRQNWPYGLFKPCVDTEYRRTVHDQDTGVMSRFRPFYCANDPLVDETRYQIHCTLMTQFLQQFSATLASWEMIERQIQLQEVATRCYRLLANAKYWNQLREMYYSLAQITRALQKKLDRIEKASFKYKRLLVKLDRSAPLVGLRPKPVSNLHHVRWTSESLSNCRLSILQV